MGTPSDLVFIFSINCAPFADYSSLERYFYITSLHNFLNLLQSILQHVHHADIKEIKATSCK